MTLFANVLAPPDMADWAWSLVAPWQEWTPEFWAWFAARLGLALPSSLVAPLNVAVALLFTAIGVGVRDHHQSSARVVSYPFAQFSAAMVAVFAIGYFALTGQSQAGGAAEGTGNLALLIFLAAAAASFSPAFAGRGDLTRRLWFMLSVLGIFYALNELTKVALAASPPAA